MQEEDKERKLWSRNGFLVTMHFDLDLSWVEHRSLIWWKSISKFLRRRMISREMYGQEMVPNFNAL